MFHYRTFYENGASGFSGLQLIQQTTVSVKIVGTLLCVLLPSMLVYTICRLNGNKQHWEGKGKHGKGKNGFCVNCPNYFCLGLCQRGI